MKKKLHECYNSYCSLQNQNQLFVQDIAMSSVPEEVFMLHLPLLYYQFNSRYDFFPFQYIVPVHCSSTLFQYITVIFQFPIFDDPGHDSFQLPAAQRVTKTPIVPHYLAYESFDTFERVQLDDFRSVNPS